MKIIHTADVHYCREHKAEALASLRVVRDTATDRGADLVVISGDLFDRGIQATDRDGMGELLNAIGSILLVCPVVAVYGTPTHDAPGCYDVLESLRSEHGFYVLDPDETAFLEDGRILFGDEGTIDPALMVLGCPEPSKTWLLGQNDLGSAEAAEAVREAMRGVLLGLGSMRRAHPGIPCVMVYHGSVRGATMGSGQVVGSTELAIGSDDLGMVGADYYALGHIHQSQHIESFEAYYAGSAYPVDWGELDQKGCNLVTIGEGVSIERIPFPHPPRMKLVATVDDGVDGADISGKQTWLVLRDSPEALRGVDVDRTVAWLVDANGAAEGSRVTLEPIPVETVRAQQITGAPTLAAKLAVYAEASGKPQTASAIRKAADLEEKAAATGAVGKGAAIRIRSLTLRGAIGVWKGLGVDEITLDLDAHPEGLLALVGPNGAGKSTLIENLHPYPEMLTRSGALQQHFRLKDSKRELVWSDETSGVWYRALILIDPTLATPKAEYYLYHRNTGYQWEPMTDGRKDDYVKSIADLWGSIDLFLRSAFVAQKPPKGHPDLADATPAERKALFRELGGLDYLQTYAEMAADEAEELEADIHARRSQAEILRPMIEEAPSYQAALEQAEAASLAASATAAEIKAAGTTQKHEVERLAEKVAENTKLVERRSSIEAERGRLQGEMSRLSADRIESQNAVACRGEALRVVEKGEALRKAKEDLDGRRSAVLADHARRQSEYAGALEAHRDARDTLTAQARSMETRQADLERRKATLVAQVDAASVELDRPLTTRCPTCEQVLPEEKIDELQADRHHKENEQNRRQEQILQLDAELIGIADSIAAVTKRRDGLRAPDKPVPATFDQQDALDAVVSELAKLPLDKALDTVRKADAAQAQIDAARKREADIGKRLMEIELERKALNDKIDERATECHRRAETELERLRDEYTKATAEFSRLAAQVAGMRDRIADIEAKRAQLADIEKAIAEKQAELDDWSYLERACGRDGIQALELDAMGPSIAETANNLLDAAYGTRFRVEIRTTRIAGRGSKTKQVEDFEIIVRDTEKGTEQPLDTLSGGETVWLRKALYAAFGIIRARSTGHRFETVCLDEADGALDPDARRRYVAMLKAEHDASGRAHTIVISHSDEAQEAIGQRVEMGELAWADA